MVCIAVVWFYLNGLFIFLNCLIVEFFCLRAFLAFSKFRKSISPVIVYLKVVRFYLDGLFVFFNCLFEEFLCLFAFLAFSKSRKSNAPVIVCFRVVFLFQFLYYLPVAIGGSFIVFSFISLITFIVQFADLTLSFKLLGRFLFLFLGCFFYFIKFISY